MSTEARERLLVLLSQWLGRILQYSPSHPACAELGRRTHEALAPALAEESPLAFGVLREDVLIGDAPARHPAVRARLGPSLHERGVLVLRVLPGATAVELGALLTLLTQQAESLFDAGGLARLLLEKGATHLQVDEIAHDITNEEREAQRRRKRVRDFFKEMLRDMLASRATAGALGEHVAEMLEHPEVVVAVLEEDAAGVSEAAAGFALMVRQEQERSGAELAPKVHDVLLRLAPRSRGRVLLDLPALVGDFRQALAWALGDIEPDGLARMFFPAVRAHATDLDGALYAMGIAVPHDGRRLSALRRAGLTLFDLPADDAAATDALRALSRAVADYDSYRRERECLREAATRALALRTAAAPPGEPAVAAFTGADPVHEVVTLTARTRGFDRFCKRLPYVAAAWAAAGDTGAAIGLVTGLAAAAAPPWTDVARETAAGVAIAAGPAILADLDERSAAASATELEEMVAIVRPIATHAPAAALDRLDVSESRKMRRLLLDALAGVGPPLLPLLAARLRSTSWFVVRNAVLLAAKCGGAPGDLAPIARHAHDRVRVEIVRALRAMPPSEGAMDLASSYLSDASAEVRAGARGVLRGELVGAAAIAAIARIATAEDGAEDLRRGMLELLARSPRDEAASALFDAMQPRGLLDLGPAAELRDAAAAALRRCPAPRARALMEEGLRSSVKRVRRACEKAMGSG